jgi:hypothetical protein
MELNKTYKYLGIEEGEGIYDNHMKEKQGEEYYRLVQQILKTESYSKNKIIAISTLAVPVVVYSFGIVSWLRKEVEKVDQRTIKLQTVEGILHPKAYLNGLYIKRQNGGCGIVELESAHNAAIFGLSEYINPLNAKLNPTCHLLALLGAHHIFHVSRERVKEGKDRLTRLVQEYDAGKARYSL